MRCTLFRATIGALLWILAPSFAFALCSGPDTINGRLKAAPSAEAFADLGNWFAGTKQFECAASAFASASGLDPMSEPLAYLWGLSLYSAGHDADSLVPLRRAAKLEPADIRPHLALGAALATMKQTVDAEEEYRSALAIDANSSVALEGLSQVLLDQKDYPGVVALLSKPGSAGALSPIESLNLGIALAGMVKLNDAATVLHEGLNTAPDSLPIADELAFILMLLGRVDEAYVVFDLALEKHPNDQSTQLLFLRIMVSGHSQRAPLVAGQLLAAYPDQWEVLYLSAVLEARDGEFQKARAHLEHSIAQNATYAQSHRALGEALARLGDLQGAKEHLDKAIALGEDAPEVQYDLARVLHTLGDTNGAEERLHTYLQLKEAQSNKSQAAGKAESADQEIAAGNAARAVSLYREALASDADEPLLHYKLAKALEKMNDVAGETVELDRAIQLDPKLAEAQNQRGYLAARAGDTIHAKAFFQAAVQASPSYAAAWVNLAATLASESKWQEAKTALDHALEIDPDNALARQLGQEIAAPHADP
jgi:tetratricopeptide (TPR) repeat protein